MGAAALGSGAGVVAGTAHGVQHVQRPRRDRGGQTDLRHAFRRRRCLIPADGFYEWRTVGKRKQPYCIAPTDGEPFAFAGLWERWERDGTVVESCTIVVTTANATIAPLRDRMPVILARADEARWLDPALTDPAILQPLLVPLRARAAAGLASGHGGEPSRQRGTGLNDATPVVKAPKALDRSGLGPLF